MAKSKLFYEQEGNFHRAIFLSQNLLDDCDSRWDYVEQYWYALGYDIFFVRKLRKCFINTQPK